MSLWQFTSVKEGSRNPPLKFGQNRASNSWDMASFLMVNYRDPNKKKNPNCANSVVDFAASSRSWGELASWGCSLTDKDFRIFIFDTEQEHKSTKNDTHNKYRVFITFPPPWSWPHVSLYLAGDKRFIPTHIFQVISYNCWPSLGLCSVSWPIHISLSLSRQVVLHSWGCWLKSLQHHKAHSCPFLIPIHSFHPHSH